MRLTLSEGAKAAGLTEADAAALAATRQPWPKTREEVRALGDTVPAELWQDLLAADEAARRLDSGDELARREHAEARERIIDRIAEYVPWRPVHETQVVRAPHWDAIARTEGLAGRQRFLRVQHDALAHRGLHPRDWALFQIQTWDAADPLGVRAIPGDVVCVKVGDWHLFGEYRREGEREWVDAVLPDGTRGEVPANCILGPVLEVQHNGYTFYGVRCLEGVPDASLVFWAPRADGGAGRGASAAAESPA